MFEAKGTFKTRTWRREAGSNRDLPITSRSAPEGPIPDDLLGLNVDQLGENPSKELLFPKENRIRSTIHRPAARIHSVAFMDLCEANLIREGFAHFRKCC